MITLPAEDAKPVFDSLFDVAVDRHDAGHIGEALQIFQALSVVDPRDFGVWQAMARCHEDLGQSDVAAVILGLAEQIQEAVAS